MEDPLQAMVSELHISNGDLKLCCYAQVSLNVFYQCSFQLRYIHERSGLCSINRGLRIYGQIFSW